MDKTVKAMLAYVKKRADDAYNDYKFFKGIDDTEYSEDCYNDYAIIQDILLDLEKIAEVK